MSMVSIWVYVYFYRQIFILLDHYPMNQQGDSRLSQINSIKKTHLTTRFYTKKKPGHYYSMSK